MKTTKFYSISLGIILSGLFFFSASLSAQESFELKGNVINLTKERVQNANVILMNSVTKEEISNVNCNRRGEFTFTDVVPGEYVISVNKEGYKKHEFCVIQIDSTGRCFKKSSVMTEVGDSKFGKMMAAE